ncbi:hypothetical protein [uncultured Campylobacter sp.]|jgi:hypothetical protein|uniref:hypothetical protein n=1 Tax=uncultured Campylobacter sp. TaxID=218934 RepID=UPI00262D5866|nr:hypothetical protein [uncultured Campylobacter sp.]
MQEYPEVYSLEESLAILKKYKSELTREQYESVNSTIRGFAIEDMYLNERDIKDLVAIHNGADAEELIKRVINE